MWFWVWTVLVVGTLVGAFFLGRDLWRRAKALGRELARASEVLDRLQARADELTAQAAREAVPTGPTLFDDPDVLRERVEARRAARADRRAARQARREVVWQRWTHFNE